ncbi:glycosyltransferase [Arenicella xantha]|uniref:GT2 family glycosyltransferase n=1 Tax=Arenicella xantha TaxID=644221 RepID=A0A395JNY5_9GAMM|nr:glycosyltransferase [Arenicella xantha]RBP51497.1 GT2 family glycosyltransferase [Arenicella xantha]
MRKIVVHGVHRSGTSASAGILERAGLWYADEQNKMPPRVDNQKGFWERLDVVELNDKILASLNMSWFTLAPALSNSELMDVGSEYLDQIRVIADQLNEHDDWFLKEPRLSITWPLWKSHLNATHHVWVVRHPISVAKSLHTRNGIPIEQGLVFWYHQTRMLASSLVDEPNVFCVEFDGGGAFESKLNEFLQGVSTLAESSGEEASDEQRIFDSGLVKHFNDDASKQLSNFPVIEKAWKYAVAGDAAKILALPEVSLSEFSWHDLESRMVFSIEAARFERDQAQLNSQRDNDAQRWSAEKLRLEQEWHASDRSLNEVKTELGEQQKQLKEYREKITKLECQAEELQEKNTKLECQAEERHSQLIDVAVDLKHFMRSKRYTLMALMNKVFVRLRLIKHRTLHSAFDKSTHGITSVELENVLPADSTRLLMLKGFLRNPRSFLRRVNRKRVVKALRLLVGKNDGDIAVRQALLQYDVVDPGGNSSLDIHVPSECPDWPETKLEFQLPAAPVVSIVIPVFNNYLTTFSCLLSIHKHTDNHSLLFEVIIADDCSSDQTAQLGEYVKGIRIVRGDENQGFLLNCNSSVTAARGKFIVLLNNDTNVQAGWLSELISPLEHCPEIGITGPKFVYPDGRLQEAGGIIFSDASGWNYGRFDQPNKPEYEFSRDVDYVSGACLVFKKSLWSRIGGFDTEFAPAYYEDTDFCFQARALGLRVRFVASSTVVHFEGVSHGSNEDSGIKKYQVTNRKKFREKWQQTLDAEHYTGPEDLFSARVHGRDKKTVLFVDHHVPFHDKDAGSKVAQRYVELMVERGIHVIFLGDNFYPHQPYTRELQSLGVEVLYGEYFKNNWYAWLQEHAHTIDAVYLNRPHITVNYIDKILALENPPFLAYHGADLHYIRVGREELLGIRDADARSSDEWKEIEFDIMRKCDISMWLSENEVDTVKKEDPSINVAYKPMYWFEQSDVDVGRHSVRDRNILFVGGFGHPPNLDGINWFLDKIFPEVLAIVPDVKLSIIGSNSPAHITNLQSDAIDVLGYVSESELVSAYGQARVSIVPLRYGAGVKGKVIESMQYGVPVVTTPIGAEGLPGDANAYLSVRDTEQGVIDQLVLLLTSDDACDSQVSLADKALIEYFSKDAALTALTTILGLDKSDEV